MSIATGPKSSKVDAFSCRRQFLGSSAIAEAVARRAIANVEAYRRHLNEAGVPANSPFQTLPLMDKASYLRGAAFADLLGDDIHDTFTIFRSAGSTGSPFYWPQLRPAYVAAPQRLGAALDTLFNLSHQPTLAVVGLALGSWIGGDLLSWSLKNVALSSSHQFAVFSPGNHHEEIVETLKIAESLAEQVLLVCCPSAIGHLRLLAEQTGKPLPEARMRYLVLGEPFPERMRQELDAAVGPVGTGVRMASLYGSADTGILGVESPASIQLRQLCAGHAELAEVLGFSGPAPHFFHMTEFDTYLEDVDGELCVTRWQGIPLVRYNLHDAARLFDFPALIETLARLGLGGEAEAALQALALASKALPTGLIAISGRADASLNLGGTKFSEAMIDEAVHTPDLAGLLTGAYEAEVILEKDRQRLRLCLEIGASGAASDALVQKVYPALVEALGKVQPEFLDDWQNVYRRWDGDPARSILKIDLVPWPMLSKDVVKEIKKHGLVR